MNICIAALKSNAFEATSRCIQVGSFLVHDQILVGSAGFQSGRFVLQYAPCYYFILFWVTESVLERSNQTDFKLLHSDISQ